MLDACDDKTTVRTFRAREIAIAGSLLVHPASIAARSREIVRAVTLQVGQALMSAALLGGLCIAITHPFANGNGRCSRAFTWLIGTRYAGASMTPWLIALHMQGGRQLWGAVLARAIDGDDLPFWRHMALAAEMGNRLLRQIEDCTSSFTSTERERVGSWGIDDVTALLGAGKRLPRDETGPRAGDPEDRALAEKLLFGIDNISGSLYTRF